MANIWRLPPLWLNPVKPSYGWAGTTFYLPSTGAAAVSPGFDGGWEATGDADRLAMVTTRISSAFTDKSITTLLVAGQTLFRQYVSAPLQAQTFHAPVFIYARAMETLGSLNGFSQIVLKVVSNDGSTMRGTLLSIGEYSGGTEWNTATRNKAFVNGRVPTPVTAIAGDRIVLEIGLSHDALITTAAINFGDNSSTDLPRDEVATAADNPSFLIAQTVLFQAQITQAIGSVTEIETSRALTFSKSLAIARVTETETARALTYSKSLAIGRITEVETSRALTYSKSVALGRTTEVESARILTANRARAVSLVTEAELARALTFSKALSVARVTETESARTLTANRSLVIVLVTELETAGILSASKVTTIGRVTETETARAFTYSKSLAIGRITEAESARIITANRAYVLARAIEIESGRSLTFSKSLAIGRVTEVESSRILTYSKFLAIGMVTEIESARTLGATELHPISRVTEIETSRALTANRSRAVGRVTETETVRPFTYSKSVILGRVTETEITRALMFAKSLAIGRVIETEQARPLTVGTGGAQTVIIGRVTESETARELTASIIGGGTDQHTHGEGGTQQQQTFFLQAARRAEMRARQARRRRRQRCEHQHLYFEECEPYPLPRAYKRPPLVFPDVGLPTVVEPIIRELRFPDLEPVTSPMPGEVTYIESIIRIPKRVPVGIPATMRKALHVFKSEQEEQSILRDFYVDDAMLEESLERSIIGSMKLPMMLKATVGTGVELVDDWFDQDKGKFVDYLKRWAPSIPKPKLRNIARAFVLDQLGSTANPETSLTRALRGAGVNSATVAELMTTAKPVVNIAETVASEIGGQVFLENAAEMGIEQWQWRSVHDDLVDDVCQELDGQIFDIGEPFEKAHPNCRCFPAAYISED